MGVLEITCLWGGTRATPQFLLLWNGNFRKGSRKQGYVRQADVHSALQEDTPVITHGWPPRSKKDRYLHVRVPREASASLAQCTGGL